MNFTHYPALITSTLLLAGGASSSAALIYGLTSGNDLISFDSATPGTTMNHGIISQPGMVDIDFYPANGQLYGITASGDFYTINTSTAAATLRGTPNTNISTVTDMDFNPAADRMRIFSSLDRNFRLVPDFMNNNFGTTGAVVNDGVFSNTGANLVGSAYTNNFDGVGSTTLYSIDFVSDALMIHSGGPQFSTITPVGSGLGIDVGLDVGFDIGQNGVSYLTNGNQFYTVNLATGTATANGTVGGSGLVSIAAAAVPEPTSSLILGLGACLLGLFRRRS